MDTTPQWSADTPSIAIGAFAGAMAMLILVSIYARTMIQEERKHWRDETVVELIRQTRSSSEIGRYQFSVVGQNVMWADTATGTLWIHGPTDKQWASTRIGEAVSKR